MWIGRMFMWILGINEFIPKPIYRNMMHYNNDKIESKINTLKNPRIKSFLIRKTFLILKNTRLFVYLLYK